MKHYVTVLLSKRRTIEFESRENGYINREKKLFATKKDFDFIRSKAKNSQVTIDVEKQWLETLMQNYSLLKEIQ